MQINRTGYFLIAFFGLLGLVMCIGPLLAGAGSQWISGHALLFLMAAGAAGLVVLTQRRGAFEAVSA